MPRYLTFGYFFSSCSKPCCALVGRADARVDADPGDVARAADRLDERVRRGAAAGEVVRRDVGDAIGLLMNVSTVITGIPASIARWIGAISAVLSVGAMRIASGFRAIAPFRNGICVGGENCSGEPVNRL